MSVAKRGAEPLARVGEQRRRGQGRGARMGGSTTPPFVDPLAAARSLGQFTETKLHRPAARTDWVPRGRLIDALDRAVSHPVTLVAAPAGYGKTTLAAQWLHREGAPAAAWVSLDEGDNDPDRLWIHVAAALGQAGCSVAGRDGTGAGAQTATAAAATLVPALLNALAAMSEDIVLVLDDFYFVRDRTCHHQVQHLIANLPPQAHVVLLTRSDPGLRLGRLRASGDLAEIRARDLCFTTEEATALLAGDGVDLSDEDVALLMDSTEGWPAGLSLATLSLAGRTDSGDFVRRLKDGTRFIGDYLIEEVLSRHDERVRDFILTASILDRFSAALCDHVAGTGDSAAVLRELERSNLFLVPLDEVREWFRFHHLFAAVARSELEYLQPERVRVLHARAARWFQDHGHVDEAVTHLIAAGRTGDAARLVHVNWVDYVDTGRDTTVWGWLKALGWRVASSSPAGRVTAAWMAGTVGDEASLTSHLEALTVLGDAGPLPDGARSPRSAADVIEGFFGYSGPLAARAAARRAVQTETDPASPYHAFAHQALGHAAYLLGDLDQAVPHLRLAAASEAAPVVTQVLSLSLQSLVECERGDVPGARTYAEQAMALVDERGLRASPLVALAFTAYGRAQASVDPEDALLVLQEGLRAGRRTTSHGVWGPIHHRLATAHVAALCGRHELAGDALGEMQLLMSRFPDGMEAMRSRTGVVTRLLRQQAVAAALDEPLTGRELDVLRLLGGDLTLHEIADELYLTSNTVKTHVRAIYRKLGSHSRSDAVVVARRRSLL